MFSHCWGGGRLAETPAVRCGIPNWEGAWTIPLFLGLCPWRSSSHFLWLFILFFAPRTRVFYMSEVHVSCFSLLCCFSWTHKANIPPVTGLVFLLPSSKFYIWESLITAASKWLLVLPWVLILCFPKTSQVSRPLVVLEVANLICYLKIFQGF